MFKKVFSFIILSQFIISCGNDDEGGINYLSPQEQKIVDAEGIELILQNYYLNDSGDLTELTSSDTTRTPLKDLVTPLPNGGYYYIIEEKQGTGKSPDKNDSILLNYGVKYFKAFEGNNSTEVNYNGDLGPIYYGTDAVERPSFYYYDFDAYVEENYENYDYLNEMERNDIKTFYDENNIYNRNVISEFVEGIQKFKERNQSINAPLDVQGIIIAPSPNSKGLDSYRSFKDANNKSIEINKDYILVFNVDLLSVKKID